MVARERQGRHAQAGKGQAQKGQVRAARLSMQVGVEDGWQVLEVRWWL